MNNYRTDITKQVVSEMNKTMTHKQIAKHFGVSAETISRTARGEREHKTKKKSSGICECCNLSPKHPGFRKLCYACFTGKKNNLFDYDALYMT